MTKFSDEFNRRVTALAGDAKVAGLSMAELCRQAGAARSTPERWRQRVPKSVALLDAMEGVIEKAKAARAK